MDLYKAINDEEIDRWNDTERLPKGATFTSSHEDAVAFGMEFITGRVYIASIPFDPNLFENIGRHDYYGLTHDVDLRAVIDKLVINPLSPELLHVIKR